MESGGSLVKMGWPVRALRSVGRAVLDLAYPPTCLVCDEPVERANALCPNCFAGLRPITAPYCPVLGIPFREDIGPGALSAEAVANPPPYARSRSALVYNEVARALVSRMKYGDRPELASFCARLMHRAGSDLWASDAVLVPVPLNRWRQLGRLYNQSSELCRELSAITGLPVATGLVSRRRNTRRQVGLTRAARQRNVSGAFLVRPDILARLKGRRVILVDDVITTGATIGALARVLRKAGVDSVDAVSFARVVVGAETTI